MKNIKKYIYIGSEVDKFLEKYEDKNIFTSYKNDDNDKIKIDTEKITKSLKKLRNKLINFSEFNEEYNKFKDNITKLDDFKSEKERSSVSAKQNKKK